MAGRGSPGSRSAYKMVGRFVLIAAACTLVMLVAGSRSAYKTVGRFVLIAAACTLVMLVAGFWPQVTILDRMELRTVDWRFHMRGPLQPHPDIVVVTVDEASLDEVGKWPWPRAVFARLTRQLAAAGARAIVYVRPGRG